MASTVILTVSGQTFEVYPDVVDVIPELIGGDPRRSVGGKMYRKIIGEKNNLTLTWSYMAADEKAILDVFWTIAKQGTVSLSCSDPYFSGTYIITDKTKNFKLIEGSILAYQGSISFGEQ